MNVQTPLTKESDDSPVLTMDQTSQAALLQLDSFINKVDQLPPSPRLLLKLLDVFKQPNQEIQEVVSLITIDPSYTAEVLKRCNGVYFAGAEPVEDVSEAVTRLGFEELYKIVTAMFATKVILRPGHHNMVDVLWNHSASVAVAASVLAEEVEESALTAFTAGLLHEVGKVLMITAREHDYVHVVQSSGMFKRPIYLTEREFFGFDHAQVGARLLERWHLPKNIVAAVAHHHELAGAEPFERLSALIFIANVLAHGTGESFATAPKSLAPAKEAMERVQLSPEKILSRLPAMQVALKKARSLLIPKT